MLPTIQILLLFCTTILFHICITNPNHTSASDHQPDEGYISMFTLAFGPKLGKLIIWTSTLYQVLYLFLENTSLHSTFPVFSETITITDPLPFTFASVLGYTLMIIGGVGRIWCYKTLGSLFTFKVTIRSSHRLIKTGPYAYVRHPSYTFVCLQVFGMLLIHQRLKNFFPNNSWVELLLGPFGLLVWYMIPIFLLKRRVTCEENELKKHFGKEWIEYASQTKKFIPKLI